MEFEINKTVKYFESVYKKNIEDSKLTPENYCSINVAWTLFHNAIINNDKQLLLLILKTVKTYKIRSLMCNACLDYSSNPQREYRNTIENFVVDNNIPLLYSLLKDQEENDVKFSTRVNYQFQLPLALGCIHGDKDVVQLLLDNGANLASTDSEGSNIFHNLSNLSQNKPDTAVLVYEYILSVIHTQEEKYMLITSENNAGFTPLDIAAEEHCVEFVLTLLHTDNVYRFVTADYGPYQTVLYDISRYECNNEGQFKFHFLYNFALVPEKEIESFHKSRILHREPFKSWRKSKKAIYISEYILWFFGTLTLFALYMTQILLYYLHPEHPIPIGLSILLLTTALSVLTVGTISLYTSGNVYLHVIKMTWNYGLPIGYCCFYEIMSVIASIYIIISECLHLTGVTCSYNPELFTILYSFGSEYAWLSLMLLTQAYFRVANLLTLINKMLFDIIMFLVIWFLMFLTYVIVFYMLTLDFHCESWSESNLGNTTTEQEGMFQTFWRTAYDTILLGLYIVPPKPLYFENHENNLVITIIYMAFVLYNSILMMNAIIATITNKISKINKYKDTVKNLQVMNLSLYMEETCMALTMSVDIFRKLRNNIARNYLVKNEDSSMIFLKVIEETPHLEWNSHIRIKNEENNVKPVLSPNEQTLYYCGRIYISSESNDIITKL